MWPLPLSSKRLSQKQQQLGPKKYSPLPTGLFTPLGLALVNPTLFKSVVQLPTPKRSGGVTSGDGSP